MNDRSAFDHRPDPELGPALRALLTAEDDAAFVSRVVEAAALQESGRWWEVLGSWAAPGFAAALVLAAVSAWFAVTAGANGDSPLGDPLAAASEAAAVPAYLISADVPDVDAVMTALFEDQ